MQEDPGIFIGRGEQAVYLLPRLANRHGLIAGATGTGKTVSLQVLAEDFSRRGVPVFMADVKGDLSGISQAGTPNPAKPSRWFSGICSGSRGTGCAPRSLKWGRCCWHGCWT